MSVLGNLEGGPGKFGHGGDQTGNNTGLAYTSGMPADDDERHEIVAGR